MKFTIKKLIDYFISGGSSGELEVKEYLRKNKYERLQDADFELICSALVENKKLESREVVALLGLLPMHALLCSKQHFAVLSCVCLLYIEHPSGNARYAVVRLGGHLRSNALHYLFSKPQETARDFIFGEYSFLGKKMEELLEKHNSSKFSRYKYINNMPASIYKSVQLFLTGYSDERIGSFMNNGVRNLVDVTSSIPSPYTQTLGVDYGNEGGLWDLYYTALDNIGDNPVVAENISEDILGNRPDFLAAYDVLFGVVITGNQDEELIMKIVKRFEKGLLKKYGGLPTDLEWADMDDRPIMRCLCSLADIYFEEGKKEEALEIGNLLLSMNPHDNQGVRYVIAGWYEGFGREKLSEYYERRNGKQNLSALEDLLAKQNRIHKFYHPPKD